MGIVSGLTGVLGGGKVKSPKIANVGADYKGLLNAYSEGVPTLYNTAAEYQPRYAELSADTMAGVAPAIMSLLRSSNPENAALLAKIRSSAGEGDLNYGGNLPPGMLRQSQQLTRAGQAARGMGFGPGDVYRETGDALRLSKDVTDANRAYAMNAAQLGYQFETDPFLRLLGGATQGAANANLTPAGSLSLLEMPYAGRLSAATSSAANMTSLMNNASQGFDSAMSKI